MTTGFRSLAACAGSLFLCALLVACGSSSSRHLGSGPPGGGGTPLPPLSGGGFPPPPSPPDPGAGQVVITGLVTFDRVPFSATAMGGLDYDNVVENAPVRRATVELLLADDDSLLDARETDDEGRFAFAVDADIEVRVRVKAEMVREGAPAWDFRVLDNTDGDALYALEGQAFNTGTAASLDVGEIHAPSGWDTGAGEYDDELRSAAPFAILDVVYESLALVLESDDESVLPPLELHWSPANDVDEGTGDEDVDLAAGDIGTTFYSPPAGDADIAGIYILGSADDDSDEYDRHVLAHEWAHFFQDMLARDDSLGGGHDLGESLDLTVAFSEGWADAFSGMPAMPGMPDGDPVYRDSFGAAQGTDFDFDLESNTLAADFGGSPGWFSEGSIASLVYDLYDAAADGEGVEIPFSSLRAALEASADTDAFTSIYPFVRHLSALEDAQSAGIEALLTAQDIVAQPADDFGSNETNNDGDPDNLPIFTPITIGGATERLCVSGSPVAFYNALGNRRYLTFDVVGLAQPVTITVAGSAPNASTDPDAFLYAQGEELAGDEEFGGPATIPGPGDPDPLVLEPGTYVIDAYDFRWIQDPPAAAGTRCFDVTVTSP
jgi:hypothetical protein